MRSTHTLGQNGNGVRSAIDVTMPVAIAPTVKEIPYDYVARFTLRGERGNRVQEVINISTEGAFVAVAIGYSFIPTVQNPLLLPAIPVNPIGGGDDLVPPPTTTLVDIVARTIVRSFELDVGDIGTADADAAVGQVVNVIQSLVDPRVLMQCLLMRLCGIDFKYSIIDSGSGRELQNQPIHNIAGLGEANGNRPFRPMAKPMIFQPRSTIRIEIEEISEGPLYGFDELNAAGQRNGRRIGAELFIVLHGYKMLGYGT